MSAQAEQAIPDAGGRHASADEDGLLAEILAELRELRERFDSKIRYDEAKERQIEALHEELQGYRQGLYRQILHPVLADLIGVYDEVAGQLSQANAASEEGLKYLLEMVEMALDRHGAAKFTCEGDIIERSRQKVLNAEPTADPELDKRIARRLRPGFEFQGRVLRPEWVAAYRYEQASGAAEASTLAGPGPGHRAEPHSAGPAEPADE
jgi:molecular chaperone GrpE (heat shock protein)